MAQPIDAMFREPAGTTLAPGHCRKCGFDLGEDPMPQCPQCGNPAPTSPPEQGWATIESCPKCSYDLRGAPQPRCPECGADFEDHIDVADIEAWQRMAARRKARCPKCRTSLHGTKMPRCPKCGLTFRAVRDGTQPWRICLTLLSIGLIPVGIYLSWFLISGRVWTALEQIAGRGTQPILVPALYATAFLFDLVGLLYLIHGRHRFRVRSEKFKLIAIAVCIAFGLLPGLGVTLAAAYVWLF